MSECACCHALIEVDEAGRFVVHPHPFFYCLGSGHTPAETAEIADNVWAWRDSPTSGDPPM